MKIFRNVALGVISVVVFSTIMLALRPSHAAASVNYNDLISDAVFDNTNTMTSSQIDTFLNSFPSSCISSNNGFRAIDPTGYNPTNGFLYGGNVTAGKVIYDAAQAYDINPQVLLATLQKEQSLVTGTSGCSTLRYVGAMGYGCPDGGTTYSYSGVNLYTINGTTYTSVSGTCVSYKAQVGFSQQVIHAAWLLKFDRERSEGNVNWAIIKTNWDNSDDLSAMYSGYMTQGTYQRCSSCTATYYDGYATIDSTSVHMDTGATASLYVYTPHLSGNSNFVNIFTSWFGSTIYPWAANITSQSFYATQSDCQAATNPITLSGTTFTAGQKYWVKITATNEGSKTWSNSFVKIGTASPYNHTSIFNDGSWPESNRPAYLTQSTVAPTASGTFNCFSVTAPEANNTYVDHFQLVADGQNDGWMPGNAAFELGITVSNPYDGQITQLSTYRDSNYSLPTDIGEVSYGQKVYVRLKVKNTGTQTWSNSFTRVATENPNNRTSVFQDSSWVATDRPASMQESSVAPGQTGTFQFVMDAPSTSGTYSETFGLVADGQSYGWMPGPIFTFHPKVVAPPLNALYPGIRLYPNQSLSSKNGDYTLVLQGDGNLVMYTSKGAIWASGTNGKSVADLVMQGDGNLVMYDTSGRPVWASGTAHNGPSSLVMQDDGNLVIYDGSGHPTWSSATNHNILNTPSTLAPGNQLAGGYELMSSNGKYRLVLQGDGNLVLYSPLHAIWASGTDHTTAHSLVMQYDGNIVMYSNNGALWASDTSGHSGSTLVMQTDGNLVLYDTNGHALWATGTNGKV